MQNPPGCWCAIYKKPVWYTAAYVGHTSVLIYVHMYIHIQFILIYTYSIGCIPMGTGSIVCKCLRHMTVQNRLSANVCIAHWSDVHIKNQLELQIFTKAKVKFKMFFESRNDVCKSNQGA